MVFKSEIQKFQDSVKNLCATSYDYSYIEVQDKKEIIATIKLKDTITLYIFTFGVGVFVFNGFDFPIREREKLFSLKKFFNNNIACELYCKKKIIEKEIFSQSCVINKLIKELWDIPKNKALSRPITCNEGFCNHGFSYILAVYCLENNISDKSKLDLLMNPAILKNIIEEQHWNSILEQINKYEPIGHKNHRLDDTTDIIASWSGVGIIQSILQDKNKEMIIQYEVKLQAVWFLFDCLIENIKNHSYSLLELEKIKSMVALIDLEIEYFFDANISTTEKNAYNIIFETSGYGIIKHKLQVLLDNKIMIEKAKITQKRAKYSKSTEILLLLIALTQIYEPLMNLFSTKSHIQTSVMLILMVVFVIASIFIIKKGN
ncbi:hypothetical protein [Helicobacter cetorum]|uniref:hypothetical protein n=1 Tax=Helicobacter cetorum TaxID=138563 RepID=UPI0013151806|nr:hypothetical protein [Helicobacter cetorum]